MKIKQGEKVGIVLRNKDGGYTLIRLPDGESSTISPGKYATMADNTIDAVFADGPANGADKGVLVLNSSHGYSFFDDNNTTPRPAWEVIAFLATHEEDRDRFVAMVMRDLITTVPDDSLS